MLVTSTFTLLLTGCGTLIPADPNGTLESVTDGTLHVGVTDNALWVDVLPEMDPKGVEPDLVRSFANEIDAEIEWSEGSEYELVEGLKHGRLDLAIGGFASDTPWTSDTGVTRPYTESADARGKSVKHVMLVPMGENAFLLELDRFLLDQDVSS
ncbi:transporter substrate-binding domain-containing protein [Arthrobacter sp. AET 35A]|uniref:transporter substrate-binding domain-containing protein n=1 Tax=Arthrobacter sp. AET 35A TaxID=2292643 RepID=UPI001CE31C53|nr:ABC transporter substrate-binding protein [Arthrobacter sp. AET 35A]